MVLLFFNEPEQNYEPLLADKVPENMHSHACGHVTIIQSGSNVCKCTFYCLIAW